ncbi:MAG: hypothetical protein GDA50_00095 [Alphaproteobacteria bacterium GM202ARS2]|nr:hypothetical protein [Alphaproteobacteria bacterium GM202ARS2]
MTAPLKKTDKKRPTQSQRPVSPTRQTRWKKGGLAGDDYVPRTKAEAEKAIKDFLAVTKS